MPNGSTGLSGSPLVDESLEAVPPLFVMSVVEPVLHDAAPDPVLVSAFVLQLPAVLVSVATVFSEVFAASPW
jgi:hypothetical protein